METLVIGHNKNAPGELWGFIVISDIALGEAYPSDENFYEMYPSTEIEVSGYKAAGGDQVRVSMWGIAQIEAVLHDEGVLKAARRLNLGAMLKGATVQWRAHCLDLADHIVCD